MTPRLTFAVANHVRKVESVLTTRMLTSVNAPRDTVDIIVNILVRSVTEAHANMVVHASAIPVVLMDILAFALLVQRAPIVRRIQETNVPIILAKMTPNVLTGLEILIAIVLPNSEVRIVKFMTTRLLAELIEATEDTKLWTLPWNNKNAFKTTVKQKRVTINVMKNVTHIFAIMMEEIVDLD